MFSKIKILHIIFLLTLIGGFLRFYNLRGTLQFLGDQGRDVLITHRLLIDKDPVFIGPVTSVGNMYLGPAYYYFMLPFHALTYPDPMGPVYAIALLSTLTIPLMFYLGKDLVGEKAALFATIIFTFTWTFIQYARFSWNPNPAPIISLVMIWAAHKAWTKDSRFWILVSIMFSLLIQLHYMTILSLGGAGIIWLMSLVQHIRDKKLRKKLPVFGISTVLAVGIFILSLTPLILFDIKHEFLNFKAFQDLLFGSQDQVRGARSVWAILRETEGRSFHILFEMLGNTQRLVNKILLASVVGVAIFTVSQLSKCKTATGELLVFVWLFVGVLGTSLYRSTVFDHYIAYLFPITALVWGIMLAKIWEYQLGKIVAVVTIGIILGLNFHRYRFQPLGWTVDDMQDVSNVILSKVQPGEKYNVVLLAPHKDIEAMNYRYFLTASDKPPLIKERFGETDTLFIIYEEKVVKNVTDLPIYEIVVFPNKNVSEKFRFKDGPEVTVLRR